MGKLLLTGVDGNLGQLAADVFIDTRTSRKLNFLWI